MLVDDTTFRRLCRARDLLAAGYHAPIPLDRAAREACLSPFHFQRLFTRTFGETPHRFLTRLRMDQARQLLAAGDLPVTEVCLEVGYTSLGTFSSRFAALTGLSPRSAPLGGAHPRMERALCARLLRQLLAGRTLRHKSQDRRSAPRRPAL
jgi:AraC-like DNA-binding protein